MVKCLAQGCEYPDASISKPHSADQKHQSLISVRLIARPRRANNDNVKSLVLQASGWLREECRVEQALFECSKGSFIVFLGYSRFNLKFPLVSKVTCKDFPSTFSVTRQWGHLACHFTTPPVFSLVHVLRFPFQRGNLHETSYLS